MKRLLISLALTWLSLSVFAQTFRATQLPGVQDYIQQLSQKYNFDQGRLEQLFDTVVMSDEVVSRVSKPFEAKPWYLYRELFITQDRIDKGVAYYKKHQKTLSRAEAKYGVPASIIVAILGVETKYGEHKGTFPVFNTLVTLSFNGGRREAFFRKELTNYLLLARENKFNPLELKGSYAGAVGLPQFMPSSYRNFAVDFTNKGFSDLFENDADAIGSIANYLHKNGWKRNGDIAIPCTVSGNDYLRLSQKNFKPHLTMDDLTELHITPTSPLQGNKVSFFTLEDRNGNSYWLGLQNFYAISTYNKSELYVMAVSELAQCIDEKRKVKTSNQASVTNMDKTETESEDSTAL